RAKRKQLGDGSRGIFEELPGASDDVPPSTTPPNASQQQEQPLALPTADPRETAGEPSSRAVNGSGEGKDGESGKKSKSAQRNCVGCGSNAHCLMRFLRAGPDGIMKGYPICNTLELSLAQCSQYRSKSLKEKMDTVVTVRQNMPTFVHIKVWIDLVRQACPEEKPERFPWSTEFTMYKTAGFLAQVQLVIISSSAHGASQRLRSEQAARMEANARAAFVAIREQTDQAIHQMVINHSVEEDEVEAVDQHNDVVMTTDDRVRSGNVISTDGEGRENLTDAHTIDRGLTTPEEDANDQVFRDRDNAKAPQPYCFTTMGPVVEEWRTRQWRPMCEKAAIEDLQGEQIIPEHPSPITGGKQWSLEDVKAGSFELFYKHAGHAKPIDMYDEFPRVKPELDEPALQALQRLRDPAKHGSA
ncbi:hypothetical protein IL306_008941, partial [Fusarium sp. DS 682]